MNAGEVSELIAAAEARTKREWRKGYDPQRDIEANLVLLDEMREALAWCLDELDKQPQGSLFP